MPNQPSNGVQVIPISKTTLFASLYLIVILEKLEEALSRDVENIEDAFVRKSLEYAFE